MWTAPNGKTFPNIGAALRAAHWGDIGKGCKTVRLTHPDYHPTIIARGGPAGWYVKDLGNKKPKPKPAAEPTYLVAHGRVVKVK